ncbi:MAG: hypothetical protein JOY59_07515 [Candidatus Eremiobacteraeota bacterium]|nr:hypothetical protein [Candidatus Eremiobacteraeota bacterium]
MSLDRKINKAIDDTKDTLDEGVHRSIAEGEQARRDLNGDQMTPGEKAKSAVNQTKHNIEAEVDRAKRDIRSRT